MCKINTVLVTDFDGTITKIDFFYLVIEKLLEEKDLVPWKEFEAGKITHFEALNRIFQKIRLTKEKLHDLILEMPLEECFLSTVNYCLENNIDIYIVSAGADYYIKFILDSLGIKDNVKIIANYSEFTPETGLTMSRIKEDSPFYSYNYGIHKGNAVKYHKNQNKTVVFAGDGTPDFIAAKEADKVFARGALLKLCKENGVEAEELDSYCRVLDYLKNNN